MTEDPGVTAQPGGGSPGGTRSARPADRLRTLDERAAGAEQPPGVETSVRAPSPEPPPPPPSVIAVGDRPPGGSAPAEQRTTTPPPRRKKQGSFLRELPILLAIAVVLALLIKTFLVQAFFIPSGSMMQTLQVHDRVLVNKLSQHTGSPQRGEIVVFDTEGTLFQGGTDSVPCPPSNALVTGVRSVQRFLGVGTCGQSDYIKRIVAVPGDTVHCCDQQHRVLVNGKPLDEPYEYLVNGSPQVSFCAAPPGSMHPAQFDAANQEAVCPLTAAPVVVPKGMYWVMGDSRDNSSDSRYNGFVPRDKIVGRAFVKIWPVSRIGFLRVPPSFAHAGSTVAAVAATPALAAPMLALPLVGLRLGRRRRRRTRG